MSRFTIRNVFKVALVAVFFPFIAFLVLIIGMGAKNKKVIFEGVIYGAVFVLAFSLPGSSGVVAALAAMGLSAVRSYMLRDLWIPRRGRKPQLGAPAQANSPAFPPVQTDSPAYPPFQQPPAATSLARPADDLSTSLTWVSSLAKQNKHRLPADTYVTILETCQMLDSVIDTESRQPSADAGFEYELEAVVSDYLPWVLQGYLAIPPSMVENRQPNGKTPNEELVEQLGLLLGQAETLHATRHSQTSADLTITGNFLRERFGHRQQGGSGFGLK
ncbi:hypothetical protein [Paeniglutamicibacter kerguelensis]